MPIYAYRCTDCGFEKDVMRKISDPPLTTCPECKTENFTKQPAALPGRYRQLRRKHLTSP
jgi:putative FmdB family regulatory protein